MRSCDATAALDSGRLHSGVLIDTVDVRQLDSRARWPIMRVLARRYVDRMALACYVRDLLSTDNWSVVRVVPHPDAESVYDVLGIQNRSLDDFCTLLA